MSMSSRVSACYSSLQSEARRIAAPTRTLFKMTTKKKKKRICLPFVPALTSCLWYGANALSRLPTTMLVGSNDEVVMSTLVDDDEDEEKGADGIGFCVGER